MARKLTLKQRTFAPEYVKAKGNGTKAAIAAGYAETSAHVRASELVRNRKVAAEINRLTRKHDVSAERVITRLDNLSLGAEAQGNYAAAIKAEELLGKSLGMWVEQSLSVNVDLSAAHLNALKSMQVGSLARSTPAGTMVTDTADHGDE